MSMAQQILPNTMRTPMPRKRFHSHGMEVQELGIRHHCAGREQAQSGATEVMMRQILPRRQALLR